MTKQELAKLQRYASNAEQTNEMAIDNLITIVESSISAIANINPDMALAVIKSFDSQRTLLEDASAERKASDNEYINLVTRYFRIRRRNY